MQKVTIVTGNKTTPFWKAYFHTISLNLMYERINMFLALEEYHSLHQTILPNTEHRHLIEDWSHRLH